jgi:hypothetical protein
MEDFATLSWVSDASVGGFESIWMALARSERVEEAEVAHASSHDYHQELATPELIVQIRRLLATERRAGRLVCRYLADLADRIHGQRDRELLAYVDEFHAAACFFDLGAREVRERVRIGRALRQLPRIETAFIAGELSYSRVREVTRVAQPDTESEWLACARDLDMRALERRVAGTAEELAAHRSRCTHFDEANAESRGVADDSSEVFDAAGAHTPSSTRASAANERTSRVMPREPRRLHTRWHDHDSLSVTFELSAEAWALLERALEGARQKAASPLADAEALAAVARDALASQNQAGDASDPRCSVVLYECRSCAKSELDTGVGSFELQPATAATLGCGAREVDLASEGRGVQRGGPLPAAIRRAVLLRDRCRCRVPGCNRRRYVDVHHLVPRSEGGEHSRRNCITVCSTHHRRLHEGKLLITGDADAKPFFEDAANQTLASIGEPGDARAARRADHASNAEGAPTPSRRKPHHSVTANADSESIVRDAANQTAASLGEPGDGRAARRERQSGEPSDDNDAATQLGTSNAPATAWRQRHCLDAENVSAGRQRQGHASNDEGPAPAARRKQQRNEPSDDIHPRATQLGTLNDSAPTQGERRPRHGEGASAPRRRQEHVWDSKCTTPASRCERPAGDDGTATAPAPQQRQSNDEDIDARTTQVGILNDDALRLLQIMGRRGNWNSDVLLERSALPLPELQHALLLLELEGRVRRRGCAFDPV